MIINPIIPIWMMIIICVVLLLLKRKGIFAFIRQVIIVILLFVINLRIMIPDGEITVSDKQIDANILFVVDDTISMLADDANGQTRLDAAKADCHKIIDDLNGARFSVMMFHNKSRVMTPFSDDGEFAKSVIDSIYPIDSFYARGTTINICKDDLINQVKTAHEKKNGKVIVFFISDGEITGENPTLDSFAEAKEYIDGGCVLGYGTKEGGHMMMRNYYGSDEQIIDNTDLFAQKPAVSVIDESNLQKLATDMGLDYVNMLNGSIDEKLIKDIKENTNLTDTQKTMEGKKDIYYIFVIPLAVIMIFELISLKRRA